VAGDFVDPPEVEEHEDEGEDEVGDRPGHADEHALPAGMRGEGAWVAGQVHTFGVFGRGGDLVRSFAGHFDVAAEGQQADLIVGIAVFDAKEAWAKAYGEGFYPDAAEFGDGEVAKLMNDDHYAHKDDEGDDRD